MATDIEFNDVPDPHVKKLMTQWATLIKSGDGKTDEYKAKYTMLVLKANNIPFTLNEDGTIDATINGDRIFNIRASGEIESDDISNPNAVLNVTLKYDNYSTGVPTNHVSNEGNNLLRFDKIGTNRFSVIYHANGVVLGEIERLESNDFVFFPNRERQGAWSSIVMREICGKLDALNKDN